VYYKTIIDGYIESVSTGAGGVPITEEEYNTILEFARSAPKADDGHVYKLRADNLEWELVELPPSPDPPDEVNDTEALAIILGGGDA
jgi:hypothetical protein